MRTLPVDGARISLISTGKAMAKPMYKDGAKIEGRQASDDNGVPLWVVDVVTDNDEDLRAEAIGVVVPSPYVPVLHKWRPVVFEGLTASIYRDKMTNQPKVSLTATGIIEGKA